MRIHVKVLFLIVTVALSACVNIPEADYTDPIATRENAHAAPVMFTELKLSMPVGSDVGYVSNSGWDEFAWFVLPANRNVLRAGINPEELSRVFSEALEGQGYDVVDPYSLLFPEEAEAERLRTEYRIGGKIINAKMDADYESVDNFGLFFYGREGISGELYLEIEWGVYDALRRTSVYKTVSEGHGRVRHADKEGMTLLVNSAFEMAAHNLGADPAFHDLVFNGVRPESFPRRKKQEDRPRNFDPLEKLTLPNKPLSRRPLAGRFAEIAPVAVLVQGGVGHGSGFFISQQGHILTNQHVVGDAQRVRIVTSGQEDELVGEVLRVDRARDVALLRLEDVPAGLTIQTLPFARIWPAVTTDIYAVGAPVLTTLQDTVTRGIVSAHRRDFPIFGTRVNLIQADVEIHGGNSGGPLLDEYGNIAAISVAAQVASGAGIGLNYFIPIAEAFEALDIRLEDAGQAAGTNAPLKITP